ncbi:MAG: carboxymethylenebutenolidase [Acidimicrobiales bacterium]|nr:MAG: carboxymethylenebutenolidase [Acidimicrobiales bacterium]
MRIELPSGTPAELVRPEVEARGGLVIIPDIMGLRPLFEEHCRRIAEEKNLVVCCPEIFPGREHLTLEERLQVAGELDDRRVLGDAVAAADATEVEPVGLIGFCIGGMYALKSAGTGRFERVVSFYGMVHVPDQWKSPTQGEPLEALSRPGAAPVLAIVGDRDPWLPAEHVEELRRAGCRVEVFPGREHGFVHDPQRPAHDPDDAARAWRMAFEHLGFG